jgi:hypothetical protein
MTLPAKDVVGSVQYCKTNKNYSSQFSLQKLTERKAESQRLYRRNSCG